MKSNIFIILAVLVLSSCGQKTKEDTGYLELRGYTQGTTYQIIYKDTIDHLKDVEALLIKIDQGFNLWDSTSVISQFNNHTDIKKVYSFDDKEMYFAIMMDLSREFYNKTNKAFDPSLLPLMELWNFGKGENYLPSQESIDSVLAFTGFEDHHIWMNDNPYEDSRGKKTELVKTIPQRKLDFNAIVQGYTVDLLADILDEKGVKNYMINVGGEIKVKGANHSGEKWSIGIQNPGVKGEEAQSIVILSDCAIATSGSYRNFKEIEGVKYSHMIDGRTGYPVNHSLLSCTVIAPTAHEADAYATAFMVMGTEEVDEYLRSNPNLGIEVYLIQDLYGAYHVTYTDGFPLQKDPS